MRPDLFATALYCVSLGFQVFPLHYPVERGHGLACSCGNAECGSPAKHPYARHAPRGLLDASKHPTAIERWWGPGVPYNIGIRTGEESGIVAVDVDPRHGGDETIAALERRFGELPQTWLFLTGGGGSHFLFKHPGYRIQNGAGSLGAGVDVRADGGYIVAPGSRHVSGRYYAVDVGRHPDEIGLAELPVWMASMLPRPSRMNGVVAPELPESWRRLVAEGCSEGRRNDAVTRLAGLLLRRNIDVFVVLDLLRCWNRERCRPPLCEAEITKIVNSIAGRELARREAAAHGN